MPNAVDSPCAARNSDGGVVMQVAGIVTPDTILRWYRRVIAQTYDGSARRSRGRPMPRRDVAALVVRLAVENPQGGYTRIRGALSHLGHTRSLGPR